MNIDRTDLWECRSAQEVLNTIFDQLADLKPPIPVELIASNVGIEQINRFNTENFEGALVCDEEKGSGIIVVREQSIPQRQRFSIGHELGHFLIPSHKPGKEGFLCKEIGVFNSHSVDGIEKEADQFSASLLMPNHLMQADVLSSGEPDLDNILGLARAYDVSMQAFLRSYFQFCEYHCCAIFSRNGQIMFPMWRDGFPYLSVRKGMPVPRQSATAQCKLGDGCISEVEVVEPSCWISENRQVLPRELYEQTFIQSDGYKVTLIWFDEDLEDPDDEAFEWEQPRFHK